MSPWQLVFSFETFFDFLELLLYPVLYSFYFFFLILFDLIFYEIKSFLLFGQNLSELFLSTSLIAVFIFLVFPFLFWYPKMYFFFVVLTKEQLLSIEHFVIILLHFGETFVTSKQARFYNLSSELTQLLLRTRLI